MRRKWRAVNTYRRFGDEKSVRQAFFYWNLWTLICVCWFFGWLRSVCDNFPSGLSISSTIKMLEHLNYRPLLLLFISLSRSHPPSAPSQLHHDSMSPIILGLVKNSNYFCAVTKGREWCAARRIELTDWRTDVIYREVLSIKIYMSSYALDSKKRSKSFIDALYFYWSLCKQ